MIYTKCAQLEEHPSKTVILAQQSPAVAQKDINQLIKMKIKGKIL